ncbi:MAG: hypothetical protein IPK00_10180 [Deltaproteobacteria bacterium]|nr:hypothetical protein [Deltaproteobacteria bacterium]
MSAWSRPPARGRPRHTGITWSLDGFYVRNAIAGPGGAMSSMSVGYWPSHLETRIRDMQQARVMNCEMEAGHPADARRPLRHPRRGDLRRIGSNALGGPAALDLDRNMSDCIAVATRAMLSLAES